MKNYTKNITFGLLLLLWIVVSMNAETIINENFDACTLPQGWTTNTTGNPNVIMGVGGLEADNLDAGSSTINGSCMFFFDADSTGWSTNTWTAQLSSPSFDGTLLTGEQLVVSMDVHFIPSETAAFNIYLYAGSTYHLLRSFSGSDDLTGWQIDNVAQFSADISQYAGTNMHLMLEYDQNVYWSFWAAIDDIVVEKVLLFENFNDCSMPAGWQNNILTGDHGWQFGEDTIWTTNMDGSCMAYFNHDALGEGAASTNISLVSPAFDATQHAFITLDVDIHTVPGGGSFYVQVFDGQQFQTVRSYTDETTTGWCYCEYLSDAIDLSPYRNPNMQVAFVYGDNNNWSYNASIDNVFIRGEGNINDLCEKAELINLDQACSPIMNMNALFDGPSSSCVDSTAHGVWYSFIAPPSGDVTIESVSDFNEVLTVFNGTCSSALTEIACGNRDEFGFTGETLPISGLNAGETYLLRISGADCTFGLDMGNTCLSINSGIDLPPTPANDNCANAVLLNVGSDCVNGTNVNATLETDELIPSVNNKSKASIWYSFVAPADGSIFIESGADFSEVIAVYSGSCGSLSEIAANDMGHSLQVDDLNPGTTYLIQITAFFATTEGNVCMQLQSTNNIPDNDICTNAIDVNVGSECTPASNINATFNGPLSTLQVPFTGFEGLTIATGNTYNRPNSASDCIPTQNESYYQNFDFFVETSGSYTITNNYFGFAGFLSIYANSFDYNAPCTNLIATANAWDFGGNMSIITTNLTAGTNYVVVTSGVNIWQNGDFTTSINGDGNVLRELANVQLAGQTTSCDYVPAAAVWFTFTAPSSGNVIMRTDADFVHTLSLYSGICGELIERNCYDNPSKCGAPVTAGGLTPGETYFLQVASASEAFGHNEGNFCLSVKEGTGDIVQVRTKIFLEGAYVGAGLMQTELQDNNLLPDVHPYYQYPWNHNGVECYDQQPSNMVDWVLLELRDANDVNVMVEQKAAILTSNGDIVDPGANSVSFYNAAANQSYYIVVRHRNHVAVMSSVAVPLPNQNPYNFTSDASYAMGDNQMRDMGDGTFALHAGDINSDGVISVADFNLYRNASSAINDYIDADCNMDRTVSVDDFNIYQPNASFIGIPAIRY